MRHGFFSKTDDLIKVEIPKLNELYHVSWAYSRGVVGICISIDEKNKTVILRRPKTGENFAKPINWSDLRHTRKNQIKNEGTNRL